ncbi:hypothetical protein P22_0156 [Propionispora sp. 2/2-37]|uniref:type 4a pilus biogenesis protein PilO n=1 Tax=Propionispora sp. 2/2-37 TaxID=1677858 RepID=UPI0006BB5826|nr:type 4a pilus biogenesis protein PilO [Propionispora sp. 2/2-37]CUH94094.1 hypothetical protein P22_0156 [Propionispora sp. 2/2-37]
MVKKLLKHVILQYYKNKIAGLTAIMACFVVIFFITVVWPQREFMKELSRTLEQKEQDIKALEEYAFSHPNMKQYLGEMEQEMERLNTLLPDDVGLGKLLEQIEQTGRNAGVQITGVRPGAMVNRNGYYEMPLEIIIRGPSAAVLGFVTRLEELPRFIAIRSMSTDLKTLETKLLIELYMFGTAPEEKQTQDIQNPD